MSDDAQFTETFNALRALLLRHGRQLKVMVDKPGDFQVGSPTQLDRIGRPLLVAGVQTRKRYVSFHLMPVYTHPPLLAGLSPALRTRMQGKACFNFKTIEADQLDELAAITKEGIRHFRTVSVPWSKEGATRRARAPKD